MEKNAVRSPNLSAVAHSALDKKKYGINGHPSYRVMSEKLANEVEQHSDQPMHFLLCGRMPRIGKRIKRLAHTGTKNAREEIDFSAFPAEITGYRKSRPATTVYANRPSSEINLLRKYHKVKDDADLVEHAEANLGTYLDNHKRKTLQIHQDWEERYMQPLEEKMKKRLNGPHYDDFSATRSRAATRLNDTLRAPVDTPRRRPPNEFRTCSRPSTALTMGTMRAARPLAVPESEELPYVKIPTSGLDDRIHKYRVHVATEARLTATVNASNGIYPVEKKLDERVTVDPIGWQIKRETRFFGQDTADPIKKGRRFFPEYVASKVNKVVGHFPE
jgi:hypothetical protein